jgi:hypothetical protein
LGIAPISLCAGGVQHTIEKLLTTDITLLQTSFQSEVYMQSYWAPKVTRVPTVGISRLPLGSPGTKCHLDAGPVVSHRVYYEGEGGGFPRSSGRGESCEFVFARGSSMHKKCSNYALINLLFGLCRSMWIIDLLVIHPSLISEFQHALLRLKCASQGTYLIHYPSTIFTLDS